MPQYTPAPTPPSDAQPPALSPSQDTNLPAPNVSISSDPPNPQPSNRTYDIAWICSMALNSSMEDPREAAEQRAQICVVITGLQEYRDAKQVETNNLYPDPKRQKVSDHSVAQRPGIPQPCHRVTVKLRYGRCSTDYTAVYNPLYSIFSSLIPKKSTGVRGIMTNKEIYEQLLKRAPRMGFRNTLDDKGEKLLEVIMSGLGDHEQDEYHFLCKRRTVIGESMVGERCELSRGEMMRLSF